MQLLLAIGAGCAITLIVMIVIIRFGPRWMNALATRAEKDKLNANPRTPLFAEALDEPEPDDDPLWKLRQQIEKSKGQESSNRAT